MDSAKLKLNAKRVLNKNFKPLVIATVILMVLEAAVYFVCLAIGKQDVSSILMLIVDALFLPGYIKMILDASRNKKVKTSDLFLETDSFFKYIGVTLVVGIVLGILVLLAAIDFKSLVSIIIYQSEVSKTLAIFLISFGLLLAVSIILLTAYIAISFSQVLFILVDRKEFSIKKILVESFDMMETFMMDYFILVLSFIGWMLFGMLTLGIAFIWITPYMLLAFAFFYDGVKEDYESYLKKQDDVVVTEVTVQEKPAAKKTSTTKKTTTKKASAAKTTKASTKKPAAKKTSTTKKTTTKKASAAKTTKASTKKPATKKTGTTKKSTTKKSE